MYLDDIDDIILFLTLKITQNKQTKKVALSFPCYHLQATKVGKENMFKYGQGKLFWVEKQWNKP